MATKYFRCTDGEKIEIKECFKKCRLDRRCMTKRSLMAASVNREWNGKPSVTQLLKPTREAYLMITQDYTVDPRKASSSMIGTSYHKFLDEFKPNGWLAAIRLENDICTGEFDAFDLVEGTLYDEKIFGAYRVARALGKKEKWIYVGTYQRGQNKGEPKFEKVWVDDGVKDILEIAIQLNYYKLLIQQHGIKVNDIKVEMFVREGLNKIAESYGLTQPVYLIDINPISSHWLNKYMKMKYNMLMQALEKKETPPICKSKYRWYGDKKCKEFCYVNESCDYYLGKYGGAYNE